MSYKHIAKQSLLFVLYILILTLKISSTCPYLLACPRALKIIKSVLACNMYHIPVRSPPRLHRDAAAVAAGEAGGLPCQGLTLLHALAALGACYPGRVAEQAQRRAGDAAAVGATRRARGAGARAVARVVGRARGAAAGVARRATREQSNAGRVA
jgi:hypothetical protein